MEMIFSRKTTLSARLRTVKRRLRGGVIISWRVKKLAINCAAPGMIIGKTIITESGIIILSENTILTGPLLEKLESLGYDYVEVKEFSPDGDKEIPDLLLEQKSFTQNHARVVKDIKELFLAAPLLNEVYMPKVASLADQGFRATANAGIVSYLNLTYENEDYLYKHSANVAIIAGLLGKWLGRSDDDVRALIIAGLLHDIGKVKIPAEILNKPGKLTPEEMDIAKKHPALAMDLLQEANLPNTVLLAILQHHERLDGSGYPYGLRAEEIDIHAKIMAVADIYDAMISNTPYNSRETPFAVIEELFKEMFDKVDPEICTVFLDHVKEALVGNTVRLSDGCQAKIIYMDRNRMVKPVVQLADGQYIDLEKRKDLSIVDIIIN